MTRPTRIETAAVHAGERRPGPEGSFVFPIFQSTLYALDPGAAEYHDIRYLRTSSTPTQRYLHEKLVALEGGEAALATSSGMAAIASVLSTLLQPGDHLLATDGLNGGTSDLLSGRLRITDELVRVSCGIEHADDLVEDFGRALEKA